MIAKAHAEDIPRLLEIWESAVLATHDFLAEEDFLFYKSKMPTFLNQVLEQSTLYKYVEEDTIQAFLASDSESIDMLFVHDMARGKGIGKSLVKYAIDALGATKVDVNEQNIQGVGFYKYMGFNVISKTEVDDFGKPYPILHLSL